MMLSIENLTVAYGKIRALHGFDLNLDQGEIVTIIGANGAGKSTTLMTTCCVIPIDKGEIWYNGNPIHGKAAEILPEAGLCQVPEGRRIFPRLTVDENLTLGAFYRKDKEGIEEDRQHVYSLFPILSDRNKQHGGTLSGGEQQMLAIARALMSRPKVLLLDEPSLGLAPLIVQQIFDIIKDVNKKEGMTILLVEQNANLALQAATRGYVLETGEITMEENADTLLHNPEIRKAYLGE